MEKSRQAAKSPPGWMTSRASCGHAMSQGERMDHLGVVEGDEIKLFYIRVRKMRTNSAPQKLKFFPVLNYKEGSLRGGKTTLAKM